MSECVWCAECRHPIAQRPDGRWQHAIPKPADPGSTLGNAAAAVEYGRELAVWTMRTDGHVAQPPEQIVRSE